MATATKDVTEFVEVNGVNVAMRSVGEGREIVLLHRFRGTLDDWDPAFLGTLAAHYRVTTFDSIGVGETGGTVPDNAKAMADFAAAVVKNIAPQPVDILGWSLGGFVGQMLAIKYPHLVRRLILAGTMPAGGRSELVWSAAWLAKASAPVPTAENALALLYGESEASQSAGVASLRRLPHPPAAYASPEAVANQAKAIQRFGDGDVGAWFRLGAIAAPTFVANGDRDGLFPAIDSVVLARQIPNSQLAIYPDSGHAFLFQHAERFVEDARGFLDRS